MNFFSGSGRECNSHVLYPPYRHDALNIRKVNKSKSLIGKIFCTVLAPKVIFDTVGRNFNRNTSQGHFYTEKYFSNVGTFYILLSTECTEDKYTPYYQPA